MSGYHNVIQEPYTALGLKLKPLTLGHLTLMEFVESAFVTGKHPEYEDLSISVFICSRSFKECLLEFADPVYLAAEFKKWAEKIGYFNFAEKVGLFVQYLKEGCTEPVYSFNSGDFAEITAPTPVVVKCALMMDTGAREEDLMDRPWDSCLMDYITIKAIKGHVSMTNSAAVSEAADVAKRVAEILNAKASGVS